MHSSKQGSIDLAAIAIPSELPRGSQRTRDRCESRRRLERGLGYSDIAFWGYTLLMSAVTEKERNQARDALQALGRHPRITSDDGIALDLPQPAVDALAEVLEAAADGKLHL